MATGEGCNLLSKNGTAVDQFHLIAAIIKHAQPPQVIYTMLALQFHDIFAVASLPWLTTRLRAFRGLEETIPAKPHPMARIYA